MHARAGLRASATLQPEVQRIPVPPADHLSATGGPKFTAAHGPTSVAKRTGTARPRLGTIRHRWDP